MTESLFYGNYDIIIPTKWCHFPSPINPQKTTRGPIFHCSIVPNSTILYELQQRWNLAKPRALFHCQFLPIFSWLAWVFDWAALRAMKLIIANPLPHALKTKRPGWYTSIFTGFLFLARFNNCGYIFSLPHEWLQFFPERVTLVAGVVGLAVECGIPAEKMPQADPAPYGMARFIWGGEEAGNPHWPRWKMKKRGPGWFSGFIGDERLANYIGDFERSQWNKDLYESISIAVSLVVASQT